MLGSMNGVNLLSDPQSSSLWLGGKKKKNSHLCLSAWLLVTAEMSQHLANCLPLVLAHLHASGPLTACL